MFSSSKDNEQLEYEHGNFNNRQEINVYSQNGSHFFPSKDGRNFKIESSGSLGFESSEDVVNGDILSEYTEKQKQKLFLEMSLKSF